MSPVATNTSVDDNEESKEEGEQGESKEGEGEGEGEGQGGTQEGEEDDGDDGGDGTDICRAEGPNTGGRSDASQLKRMIECLHTAFDDYVAPIKAMRTDSQEVLRSTDVPTLLKHWLELEDALKLFYYVPNGGGGGGGGGSGMRSAVLVDAESFMNQYLMQHPPGGAPLSTVDSSASISADGVLSRDNSSGSGSGSGSSSIGSSSIGSSIHGDRGNHSTATTAQGPITLTVGSRLPSGGMDHQMQRGLPSLVPPSNPTQTGNLRDQNVHISQQGAALSFQQTQQPQLPANTRVAYASGHYGGLANTGVPNPALRTEGSGDNGTILGGGAGRVVRSSFRSGGIGIKIK